MYERSDPVRQSVLERREHDLPSDPTELHLARVEEEAQAFVVARAPLCHVRDDVVPPIPQEGADLIQRREVPFDLLDRDQVESRQDLCDIPVAFFEAIGSPKRLNVPCRQEERSRTVFGGTSRSSWTRRSMRFAAVRGALSAGSDSSSR